MGRKIWRKNQMFCNAIGAHHDEIEMNNFNFAYCFKYVMLFSGARPGARKTGFR